MRGLWNLKFSLHDEFSSSFFLKENMLNLLDVYKIGRSGFMDGFECLQAIFGTIWVSSSTLHPVTREIKQQKFYALYRKYLAAKEEKNRHFPQLRLLLEFPAMMSSLRGASILR